MNGTMGGNSQHACVNEYIMSLIHPVACIYIICVYIYRCICVHALKGEYSRFPSNTPSMSCLAIALCGEYENSTLSFVRIK